MMSDGNGNKTANAMQFIMELEGKVRTLTEEKESYRKAFLAAITYRSKSFWLGWIGGSVVSIIMGIGGWGIWGR